MRTLEQMKRRRFTNSANSQTPHSPAAENRGAQDMPTALFKTSLKDWQAAYKAQHRAGGDRTNPQPA